MKQRRFYPVALYQIAVMAIVVFGFVSAAHSQAGSRTTQGQDNRSFPSGLERDDTSPQAESELQTGISLTRQGHFSDAVPHLLAAQGRVAQENVLNFDLALCYVGTEQFQKAIPILITLRKNWQNNAEVNNLLAQAYIGNGQAEEAYAALQKAAVFAPKNEKLYLFVAGACMDRQNYDLGLKVSSLGLQALPGSAHLHYYHGLFLSWLERPDLAKQDFLQVRKLAPESEISHIAGAQQSLLDGDIPEAVRCAREGVQKGFNGYMLLAILGEALIRSGVGPGEPGFKEAKAAFEKAIAEKPGYAGAQISLAKLYLMEGRVAEAIAYLESARKLDPQNPAVYSQLITAYRRNKEPEKVKAMLAMLAELNEKEAARIGSTSGETKSGYGGARRNRANPSDLH